MEFYNEEIGPEEARIILTRNSVNRKLSIANVTYLANEMKSGNYKQTGDTIKISKDGRLMDGQHRLNAIIKANCRVRVSFCKGLDEDVFSVIDTGKTRSSADVLSLNKNISNPNETAAATTLIMKLEGGAIFIKDKISNTKILSFLDEHPDLLPIVKYICVENKKFRMVSSSAMAALYYLFSKKNQEKADEFFNKYYTGLDLTKEDPILILREKLIRDSIGKTRIKPIYRVALVIYAWNNFRKDKTIKRLDYELGVMPKII